MTWEREGIRSSTTIINGSTNYTIRGLEPEANYTITVAARNGAGSAVRDHITVNTGRAGSMMCVKVFELYCIGGESSFFFGGGGTMQWKNTGLFAINSVHANVLRTLLKFYMKDRLR